MECILGDLFRGLGTCDHAEQDAKGDATVPVVELAERLGVSRGDPLDEPHVIRPFVGPYDIGGILG